MKLWIDAQLPPTIAVWIRSQMGFDAVAVRDLGLRDAEDIDIFMSAKAEDAMVMTKDRDFVLLLDRLSPPPRVIWLTCGNTSNEKLKEILIQTLNEAISLLDSGEEIVEINAPF